MLSFRRKVEEQRASVMKIKLTLVGIHESAPEGIVVVAEWSLNYSWTKLNVMPAKIM